MDLPKFFRIVANVLEAIDEVKPDTPTANQEILVCMHCRHVLRIDGEKCNFTAFVARQVIDQSTMQPYLTPWKYRCGKCNGWGFEFEIDEVRPMTNSTN